MPISSVSGVSSGIDWRDVIEQIREVERKRIGLLEEEKDSYGEKLSAWQGINSNLLSFKTSADNLNRTTDFNLFTILLSSNTTTNADDIMSVTASTDAAPGTYNIVVNSLASAQKLCSASYASQTTQLGVSGDVIVGGRTVTVSTTDTLSSLRDKINAVNTGTTASGVTASIVNYGTSGYRLIFTSDEEGAEGMGLLNGGSSDVLGSLGFVDASDKTAKNAITGGYKSDLFAYADRAIGGSDLLNLASAQSGTVTITIDGEGESVAIDLSTGSLNTIRDAINTAFSGEFESDPASVISETVDGTTKYRLLIEGNTITYTDANNILETLGILERAGVSDERGVTGDVTNTSGGVAITAATRFDEIDGYIDFEDDDDIELDGRDTDGDDVHFHFDIYDTDYKTIGDLLTEIESRYGDVTASVTADGRIQVVDNEIGDTQLLVELDPNGSLSFDADNNFGAITTIRSRELQAGANAQITVDGVTVTPSSNTIDDVITGVTLNLKKAASDTTVNVVVGRDYDAIKEKIGEFIDAYNGVMGAISEHLTYDTENQQPGGVLFGDGSLRTLRSNLTSIILNKVTGVSDDFSTLGLAGISIDTDNKLTINDTTLQGYLESNFNDIRRLFAAESSSTSGYLTYIYHNADTESGTYDLYIDTGGTPDDYFENASGEKLEASVNGEYISGISGDAKGLVVRYSGSETGNVGSITLTYGIAELFDQALYDITDSVDGYVANKEETLQDTIDRLEDRIEMMESRIDRKMAVMVQQFVAMETAMSRIQSQSDWLSGQINASFSGWGWT
jgi:flagellar hook-associated protein 2